MLEVQHKRVDKSLQKAVPVKLGNKCHLCLGRRLTSLTDFLFKQSYPIERAQIHLKTYLLNLPKLGQISTRGILAIRNS